ncbi:unnamed protein product, partial [Closterium sp. NIES-64]
FEVAEAFHRRGTAALSSFQTAHEQFYRSSAEVISQSPLVSGILASFQNKPPFAVPDPTKATSASPSAMHAISTPSPASSSPSPLAEYMAAGCTRPSKQQQAAVTLHTSLTLLQQLVELHQQLVELHQETVSEMEDIYHAAAARLLEENLHASAQPAGDDGVAAAAAGAVSGDIADVHNSNAANASADDGADGGTDDGAGDGTDDKDSLGGAIAGTRSSVTVQADVVTMMAAVLEMLKEDLQMKLTIVADLSLSTSAAHVSTYSMMWQLRPFVDERVTKEASRWATKARRRHKAHAPYLSKEFLRILKNSLQPKAGTVALSLTRPPQLLPFSQNPSFSFLIRSALYRRGATLCS